MDFFWFYLVLLHFPSQFGADLPLSLKILESLGLILILGKSMEGEPSNLFSTEIQV